MTSSSLTKRRGNRTVPVAPECSQGTKAKKSMLDGKRLRLVAALLVSVIALCLLLKLRPLDVQHIMSKTTAAKTAGSMIVVPSDVSQWEGCSISFHSPRQNRNKWTTKPLWVPSYPNAASTAATPATGDQDLIKPLIEAITGLEKGVKNYHVKSSTTKKCKGVEETVACTMMHPIVKIGPTPEKQTQSFYHSIILPIRNPMTVFPAFYYYKAYKYHGAPGQVDEESWREYRDTWWEGMFEGELCIVCSFPSM